MSVPARAPVRKIIAGICGKRSPEPQRTVRLTKLSFCRLSCTSCLASSRSLQACSASSRLGLISLRGLAGPLWLLIRRAHRCRGDGLSSSSSSRPGSLWAPLCSSTQASTFDFHAWSWGTSAALWLPSRAARRSARCPCQLCAARRSECCRDDAPTLLPPPLRGIACCVLTCKPAADGCSESVLYSR